MQVANIAVTFFSLLPTNLVNDIYDLADKKAETKAYFQRNVLPQVDPTLCFLSSKDCDTCFLQDCKIRISGELGSFHQKICFGCRKVRNGDVMVSAHSADQQWRAQYGVLGLCGIEQWKQAILVWTHGSNERRGPRYSVDQQHPVMTAVLVYRSALVRNRWAEEALKVARSAMSLGF
jgi:hypothetical protein